jgi:hypothetical protein
VVQVLQVDVFQVLIVRPVIHVFRLLRFIVCRDFFPLASARVEFIPVLNGCWHIFLQDFLIL